MYKVDIYKRKGETMALNINGRMKVKTLKSDFIEEFGLTLRVYDGRSFAEDDATLASIRKGDSKGGEFAPKRNTKVGNLEDKIMEMFGIKTQVAGSDDSYLCDNDYTLVKALEADEKLMVKREKRGDKPTPISNKDEEVITEDNSQDSSNTDDMSLEEVIAKIKVVYKDHEDLEEIVDDLEDDSYFDDWAEKFITEDYGNNVELAKVLFKIAEKKADNFDDFSELANKIGDEDTLGDKEWARTLFKKALEYDADRISDLTNLAKNIAQENVLADKEWAKEIIKVALKQADDGDDLENIASTIIVMLEDKEWAKEVYSEAINKADDARTLSDIGNSIGDNWSDEKELCEKAYNKGLEKAEEDSSQFYMKFYIANGIMTSIDRERGIEIGLSVIDDDRCDAAHCIEVARSIARGDVPEFQEKKATVHEKIIAGDKAFIIMELLERYMDPLKDMELFRQAGERVEELCNGSECMVDLGVILSGNGVEDWAKRVFEAALEMSCFDEDLVYIWNNIDIDDEEWVETFKEELIEKCEEDWAKEEIGM